MGRASRPARTSAAAIRRHPATGTNVRRSRSSSGRKARSSSRPPRTQLRGTARASRPACRRCRRRGPCRTRRPPSGSTRSAARAASPSRRSWGAGGAASQQRGRFGRPPRRPTVFFGEGRMKLPRRRRRRRRAAGQSWRCATRTVGELQDTAKIVAMIVTERASVSVCASHEVVQISCSATMAKRAKKTKLI